MPSEAAEVQYESLMLIIDGDTISITQPVLVSLRLAKQSTVISQSEVFVLNRYLIPLSAKDLLSCIEQEN